MALSSVLVRRVTGEKSPGVASHLSCGVGIDRRLERLKTVNGWFDKQMRAVGQRRKLEKNASSTENL